MLIIARDTAHQDQWLVVIEDLLQDSLEEFLVSESKSEILVKPEPHPSAQAQYEINRWAVPHITANGAPFDGHEGYRP